MSCKFWIVPLTAGLGTLVIVTIVLVGGWLQGWLATPQARPFGELRRDGERMIAAIERYRTEKGHYPESLATAGVVPPDSPHGPWEYILDPDGKSFCLQIGDYGRDGFIYFYSSRSSGWYADT